MAGYIARQGAARGAHNPLFVRALVLQQNEVRAGILVADLLLISNRWAKRLRRRLAGLLKTSPDHLLVAATHTHSGPLVGTAPFQFSSSKGPMHFRKHLQSVIENAMAQALRTAKESLQPVRLAAGRVVIHGIATDRNRPNLARTQSFHLFRFEGRTSKAFLGVYGCHPTVLGSDNLRFSGDLHGEIARRFERHASVALTANGSAANISTRFTRKNQTPAELSRLVDKLMKQVSAMHLRRMEAPKLSVRTSPFKLRVRKFPSTEKVSSRKSGRLGIVAEEALAVQHQLRKSLGLAGKESVIARVAAFRLGKIQLVALPFEVYASTGNFLWKKAHIVPLCYANGY
ncbi:MAG: neutral/alkaline non-lysosomal ceramidase N-terminal domain-containing protein, partial [Candidatus Acidiferrum sp.]